MDKMLRCIVLFSLTKNKVSCVENFISYNKTDEGLKWSSVWKNDADFSWSKGIIGIIIFH